MFERTKATTLAQRQETFLGGDMRFRNLRPYDYQPVEYLEIRRLLSGAFQTLDSINPYPTGGSPSGSLISDGSGNFYGLTSTGGSYGDGSIFEVSGSDHSNFSTLVSFSGTSGPDPGRTPVGLTIDANGNIFGATQAGGANGTGTLFELSADHATFTSLHSIASGDAPPTNGPLVMDSVGDLFGTTADTGSGYGVIFKLSADHSTFSTVYVFTGGTSDTPNNGLIIDSAGNIYGTTNSGSVFELPANSDAISTLATVDLTYGDHMEWMSGLVIDSAGNLYGTEESLYTSALFEVLATRHGIFPLESFTGTAGSFPGTANRSSLCIDNAGNIYGTVNGSEVGTEGSVFEVSSNHSTATVLASLTASSGAAPLGIALDSAGDLLVNASSAGQFGFGSVVEISGANHSVLSTVHSFSYGSGIDPTGNLVEDVAAICTK